MRLFLVDNIVIPSSGVFGFKRVEVKEAIQGIMLAHQDECLVNYLTDAENARRLSRLTGVKLDHTADISAWVESIEAQMEHRDTLMMYYTAPSGGQQNGKGKLFSHTFLMAVKWDFSTVQGVADIVRLSCPANADFIVWLSQVSNQALVDTGKADKEVRNE